MALSPAERSSLAHLLRRAGFGATPGQWQEYSQLGIKGTTQQLLHPETVPQDFDKLLETIGGNFVDLDTLAGAASWWIFRMVKTKRPLEEKMTLFWHQHFATAFYKVGNARWMSGQIDTFRKHALGSFRTMLQAVTRDPAMLIWLDGAQSRVGKPNENFGREVLELFSMGVGSGYTEKDVQEAARSFTGWAYDFKNRSFYYNPYLHDDGWKTFLGQSGNFHGDDIIDIIVRQPATGKFLATKLWKFFVSDDPPPPLEIERLSKIYLSSGFDIGQVVEAILTSSLFYSDAVRYAQIKTPAEYVVGVMRTLDAPLLSVRNLPAALSTMGQELLNPPNVSGWPGGREWINTRTLLARVNFASEVAYEAQRRGVIAQLLQSGFIGDVNAITSPAQAVDVLWQALMPGRAPTDKTRAALIKYVSDGFPASENAPAMEAAPAMNGLMSAPTMGAMNSSMNATSGTMNAPSKLPSLSAAESPKMMATPKVRGAVAGKLPGLLNLILSAPEYQLA